MKPTRVLAAAFAVATGSLPATAFANVFFLENFDQTPLDSSAAGSLWSSTGSNNTTPLRFNLNSDNLVAGSEDSDDGFVWGLLGPFSGDATGEFTIDVDTTGILGSIVLNAKIGQASPGSFESADFFRIEYTTDGSTYSTAVSDNDSFYSDTGIFDYGFRDYEFELPAEAADNPDFGLRIVTLDSQNIETYLLDTISLSEAPPEIPSPEPSSLALVALGSLALCRRTRRP